MKVQKKLGSNNLVLVLKQESMEYMIKKHVWFEVELQGAQRDHEAEVFQVSNNDTAVAQRRLEDKQPEEKTNTDCLRSTQQCMNSVVAKHLDVAGIQRQNGLVDEINVTLFAKNLKRMSIKELVYKKEHSNEAAFAVAAVEKIYTHKSLTFNNIVACEVISKWKAGLKDDMDVQSDVYVLSNDCRKCSDDSDGYYWEYTHAKGNVLGMDIVRDQSGNTLRVSQFSQEYQMVCTRLDIASADVGMLDKFDRGLQTDLQVFVDFDYAMGKSITVMGREIIGYGLMILGCAGSLKAN
nr:zinc finger, CCHC-type [Tanacetum cinerariifolium]